MGLDLTLYPDAFGAEMNRSLQGHVLFVASLPSHREPEFIGQLCGYGDLGEDNDSEIIGVVQGKMLPKGVKVYLPDMGREDPDKPCTEDARGEPLTYVKAGDFAQLDASKIRNKWNKAILAMMLSLPPETGVILYWH